MEQMSNIDLRNYKPTGTHINIRSLLNHHLSILYPYAFMTYLKSNIEIYIAEIYTDSTELKLLSLILI